MEQDNRISHESPGVHSDQLKNPPKPAGRTYRFLCEKPTCDEKNRPEEHDAMCGHVNAKTFTRGTG